MTTVNFDPVFDGKVALKENGCIEYLRYRTKQGYGQLWFKGKMVTANRVSYMLSNDLSAFDIVDKLVLHTCDNPPCINPEHLYAGTHQDNANDKYNRERDNPPKGERNRHAKLSEQQVLDIRASTKTQRELCAEYGLSQAAINKIINRVSWRHI